MHYLLVMKNPTMKDPKFMTHVAIGPEARVAMVDLLNITMATTIDLYTQVKQAHWNIKGPQFVSRHLLFDDLAEHLRHWADTLAERIAALGGYARGTARCASQATTLTEYNLNAVDGKAHIQALTIAYGAYGTMLRGQLERIDDPVTEDMMIEILRGAEKDLWFLESHLNV